MNDKYILRGHEAVPFETETTEALLEWARWFEHADRNVGHTRVGEFEISTIFLGLDHAYVHLMLRPEGPHRPVLFETMVFKGTHRIGGTQMMDRYSTWEEAEAGHNALVRHFTRAVSG